jgi:hypothetical protein
MAVRFVVCLRVDSALRAPPAGAAHVFQIAFAFAVTGPGARQCPGNACGLDNLEQAVSLVLFVLGEAGL